MPKGFEIKVDGLQKLSAVFKQLPKTVQREINSEFRAIGQQWTAEARADVPVDRARLKGSISFKTSDLSLEIIAQNEYAAYMEFGTKKNFDSGPSIIGSYASQFRGSSAGSKVNPIVALTAWVKRKGIAGTYSVKTRRRTGGKATKEKQDRQVAFLIWNKIKKQGVKPHPFLFSGKGENDRVTKYVSKVKNNISAVLKQLV